MTRAKKTPWGRAGRGTTEVKRTRWIHDDSEDNGHGHFTEVVGWTRSRLNIPTIRLERKRQPIGHQKESNPAKRRRMKREILEKNYISESAAEVTKNSIPNYADMHTSTAWPGARPIRHQERMQQHRLLPTSLLEKLPAEVLLMVASHIPQENQLCMALASRTLMVKIGLINTKTFSNRKRVTFLHLLESDHITLNMVACQTCLKLHSPFMSLRGSYNIKGAFLQGLYPKKSEGVIHPDLPCVETQAIPCTNFHRRLHFNIISFLMRRHRQGLNCTSILRQLQQTQTMVYRLGRSELYIQRTEKPRVVSGHFVTKAQTVIIPATGSWRDRRTIKQLLLLLSKMSDWICQHRTWPEDVRRNLLPNPRPAGSKDQANFVPMSTTALGYSEVGTEMRRVLLHEYPCPVVECRTDKVSKPEIGRPGSCAHCFTDFSMNTVQLPNIHTRALVLTTWKNLGNGASRSQKEWASFEFAKSLTVQPTAHRATRARGRQVIFRGYEEIDDPHWTYGGPEHVHRPRIKPLDVMRLHEFGERLQYETERFGEPHRPGPDGIIRYPDPYD